MRPDASHSYDALSAVRSSAATLLIAAAALPSTPARAQDAKPAQVVVARANGSGVGNRLISLIASTFRPSALSGASLQRARMETPEQALARLCGSYRPALYQALTSLNGERTPPLGQPMEDAAEKLWFPACLKVTPVKLSLPTFIPKARAETLSPFKTFVSRSVPSGPADQGATAVLATPVELVANANVDPSVAAAEIKRRGGSAEATVPMVGRIVERVGEVPPDVAPAVAAACPADATAFDPSLVKEAFEFSARRRAVPSRPGFAQVVVVDNGFFGIASTTASPFTPAFPERLFGAWAQQGTLVGPATSFGSKAYAPIVYYNDWALTTIDEVAGHGTHVAGLTVGGPGFATSRDSLLLTGTGGVSLTIVNIGNGARELLADSQKLIRELLAEKPAAAPPSTARIVNMSISYQGEQANGIFWSLFDENQGTLFVVAAGNTREDVAAQSIYPAALGNKANVLTVAAHDAGSRPALAWFTNYGSAVDIAAPGCGVGSWLTATDQKALTGTSQAAPVASFTAAALGALDSSFTAGDLKNRIIATGMPLAGSNRWLVRSGSRLDVPAALLIYDDVLTVRVPDPARPNEFTEETWIGDVTDLWGLRCFADGDARSAFGRPRENLWGLKRGDDGLWLEHDRNVRQVAYCKAATAAPNGFEREPEIFFRRRARVVGSQIQPDSTDLALGPKWTVKLSTVSRLAFRVR